MGKRVFVTGSADGLGLLAAQRLAEAGHQVVLHARNRERAGDAQRAVRDAPSVLIGDLSSVVQTKALAEQANELGRFDAVIHNAGVGYRENRRVLSDEGVERVFAVNVLAPYLLTALMEAPERLIYLSSGLHRSGEIELDDLQWERRRWRGMQAYSDSKLYDVVMAFALARRWPGVLANALEPGWVATKMGGPGAPDDYEAGGRTQTWLAVSDDPEAKVSGAYFFHQRRRETHPAAGDPAVQDGLLAACAALSGVAMPGPAAAT